VCLSLTVTPVFLTVVGAKAEYALFLALTLPPISWILFVCWRRTGNYKPWQRPT